MKITKYGASSSIIILDYNVKLEKFMVIKRVEVTRGEYSYDNAVNTIVNLNKIYKPAFIYADAGAGKIFAVLFQRHRRNKIISKEKSWKA